MQDPSNHAGQASDKNVTAIQRNGQIVPYGNPCAKLLLVDDEADGAEFAAILLSSHGLEVVVVHSAGEALRVLHDDDAIGVVLSDVRMPGITGLQLADEIRMKYPAVKIILMSGFAAPPPDHADQHYPFITKPYRIDTLLDLLHR